jgi:hypothetical protein
VRLSAQRGIKAPDQQMQQVIGLVVSQCEELGSAFQVRRDGQQQGSRLPRRHGSDVGPDHVRWRRPSEATMRAILTKPASAGAFVHGRRPSDPRRQSPGRRPPRHGAPPDGRVAMHHPGCLSCLAQWDAVPRSSGSPARPQPARHGADGRGAGGAPRRRRVPARACLVWSLWTPHGRRLSSPPALRLYE